MKKEQKKKPTTPVTVAYIIQGKIVGTVELDNIDHARVFERFLMDHFGNNYVITKFIYAED